MDEGKGYYESFCCVLFYDTCFVRPRSSGVFCIDPTFPISTFPISSFSSPIPLPLSLHLSFPMVSWCSQLLSVEMCEMAVDLLC